MKAPKEYCLILEKNNPHVQKYTCSITRKTKWMYIVFYTFPLVNLGLNNFAIVIVIPQELCILKHCYNDIRFYTLLCGHVLL